MRGLPAVLTRRRVVTTLAVVASGGAVGAAMAAGPVVYSEYTQGSDDDEGRRARVVQQDGTGDLPLPRHLSSATVSPDGTRMAQMGLEETPRAVDTWLRVSAGDGSAPVKIVERRFGDGRDRNGAQLLTGPPVWSPDGTRVIVRVNALRQDDGFSARRLVCVVATRSCRGVGRAPTVDSDGGPDLISDVVGWQAVDGPVVGLRTAAAATVATVERLRCGAPARSTPGPTTTLTGLPGSSFGPPLLLRGLPDTDEYGDARGVLPATAGAVTTQDGTLAFDAPDARIERGALRCRSARERRDAGGGSVETHTAVGMPRLRLRAGGRTTTLATPAGLRRGDGLRLVGTDTGGALLVGAPTPAVASVGLCDVEPKTSLRRCDIPSGGGAAHHASVPRVWRYRADRRAFEPVLTLRRSALRTLTDAEELAVASGDAVLAVDGLSIQRVPLDGGPPTTIARGRGISLDLSAW